MDNKEIKELQMYLKAGLVLNSIDDNGEMDWIGTEKQWSKFDELAEKEGE